MSDRTRYFNRELSWIEFNARVLDEALDKSNPLLERLKFLSIVASNFDEFFMVRVAALKAQVRSGAESPDRAGMAVEAQLSAISKRVREIIETAYTCLSGEILPGMKHEGLAVVRADDWTGAQRAYLEDKFSAEVFSSLTPLAMDDDAGFPPTGNLRIHAAFLLGSGAGKTGTEDRISIVQVPHNIDRFVPLPGEGDGKCFALLDDMVLEFGHCLFPGFHAQERALFKVTRDADIGVDEDRDDDFIAAIEEVLVNRQNSWPVRLSFCGNSEALRNRISRALELSDDDVFELQGPIDLRSFMELALMRGFERLRFAPAKAVESFSFSEENTIWDEIRKRDIVLHVPYESFSPIVRFVEEAAVDPVTLAIKATLYRTSGDSPIVKALTRAARNGKQVTVVVELKARFDEERNIAWSTRLEQAGAIVVYGAARLKVHAKAIMVIRREEDGGVKRFVHLSTGNYNDKTARLYGDISLFTINDAICHDTALLFNTITGLSIRQDLSTIFAAPFNLKSRLIELIEREAERSSPENPGAIMAKMNSLCDVDVIESLYRASAKGVRIQLNVRGICTLIPGLKGLSESISVISVVGRYLEHARIVLFKNGGAEELYLSSADWMPRNLEKRIEIMFPVLEERSRERITSILESYFKDNVKARVLTVSGSWKRAKAMPGSQSFSAQDHFAELAGSQDISGRMDAELVVRRKLS